MKTDLDHEEQASIFFENIVPILDKLKPTDFIKCMTFFGKSGLNFDKYLKLVDLYFQSISSCETKLVLEAHLYQQFLKNYQSDYYFNEFFRVMQKSHFKKTRKAKKPPKSNGTVFKKSIWFFSPNPVFLAHTNAMFSLLKSGERANLSVNIACFVHNQKYYEECVSLGANFVVLKGNTFGEKLRYLAKISSGALAVVWNGPPTHLSYASKIMNNTVYWSHRFRPGFEHVTHHLHGGDLGELSYYFDQKWIGFRGKFDIKNFEKKTDWNIRKNSFGTFCREEIINKQIHWERVGKILSNNRNLTYSYAGRKAIHEHWCSELHIDADRIIFLGWMGDPETYIMRMAFLLNPPDLSQGLMGMEALAGGIPIVSHSKTRGFYNAFLQKRQNVSASNALIRAVKATQFETEEDIVTLVAALNERPLNNEVGSILQKEFKASEKYKYSLKEFVGLIGS